MTDDEIIDAWHICSGISPGGSILELIRTLEVIFRAEEREKCIQAIRAAGHTGLDADWYIKAIKALK